MSYVPNNAQIFIAAFSGAVAGMAAAGRFNTSNDPATYSAQVAAAGAFAQEFDTVYGVGASGTVEVSVVRDICNAEWASRVQTSTRAADYLDVCNALIALATACTTYFTDQSLPNPASGGTVLTDGTYEGEPLTWNNTSAAWEPARSATVAVNMVVPGSGTEAGSNITISSPGGDVTVQSATGNVLVTSLNGEATLNSSGGFFAAHTTSVEMGVTLTTVVSVSTAGIEVKGAFVDVKDGNGNSGVRVETGVTPKLGFFGAPPIVIPTTSGSRGGIAALDSLMPELGAVSGLGLVTDGTSP